MKLSCRMDLLARQLSFIQPIQSLFHSNHGLWSGFEFQEREEIELVAELKRG